MTPSPPGATRALRGTLVWCTGDPGLTDDRSMVSVIDDGLIVIRDGRIDAVGEAQDLLAGLAAEVSVEDWRGRLILPGLIDAHVHYPQTEMIAGWGGGLLEWLEQFTFPAEARYGDSEYALARAHFFCDQLLANGTTTALVYCTVHPESVDAMFTAAEARGMRVVAGKVMMDRNCPEALRDTPVSARADCETLIRRWHGRGRLGYAVTPRFAPTSTPAQLDVAAELMSLAPDLHLQTHVAENRAEVRWVAGLFPDARSYLDVYERFGLLGPRSVLGHCLYLDDDDRARLAERDAVMAFCPTSNLFLGSGLFDLDAADRHGNAVAMATDVGAGTTLSMLRTLGEAYKVVRLAGGAIGPWRLLYLATLGAARALRLDDHIGALRVGNEADLVVLDPNTIPIIAERRTDVASVADPLFAMMQAGDDRNVAATMVGGVWRHRRAAGSA